MVQNIITSFGTVQNPDLTYALIPIQDDSQLVSIPLTSSKAFYFKLSNQNSTWDWQINLDVVDSTCAGTFYIDGALFDTTDKSSYEIIDSVNVLAGGFQDPVAPISGDKNYLGMVAPGNLPYMRIRWSGAATTAHAVIKLVSSMS